MAFTGLIVGGVALVGGGIAAVDYARKSSNMAEDAAIEAARQAQERADREEEIAKEKKEAEIKLASERLEFEKESRKEKTEFVTGQMSKAAVEVRAAAIAGYASSGIDLEEGSSSLAVIKRIDTESKAQEAEVKREFTEFISARNLEFKQLQETEELSYDWFVTRSHQETKWEVSNRLAEASAYRAKGKYGMISAGFDILGGAAGMYGTYKDYQRYGYID